MLIVCKLWVISLLQSVLNVLLHYPRMHRVGYVEQVVSVTLPAFRVRVGKILPHRLERQKFVVEVLHGELVELWYVDEEDILLLDELLPLGEDVLCVVLREHGVGTYIILRN
jgi:hypothetical protein